MLKLSIQPDDVCFALKDDPIAKDELKSLMWPVCLSQSFPYPVGILRIETPYPTKRIPTLPLTGAMKRGWQQDAPISVKTVRCNPSTRCPPRSPSLP